MIESIDRVVNAIGGFLYRPYIVPLFLLAAGLYFTIRTGLIQFRLFGESIRVVKEKPKEKGSISSFGALMVSTASRVGTGNIVGVSTAICLGGFGAVFWMWVVALVGGASAFIESALAQVYKKRDADGSSYGGPSYYMEQALHQRWLGVVFAVVLILTYVVGFNMLAAYNLQDAFGGFSFYVKGRTPYIIGAILAVLFALCVLGGGKRLTNVTGVLVPVMGLLYIVMSLVVVFMNIKIFPSVIANIFRDAFKPRFTKRFLLFSGAFVDDGGVVAQIACRIIDRARGNVERMADVRDVEHERSETAHDEQCEDDEGDLFARELLHSRYCKPARTLLQ